MDIDLGGLLIGHAAADGHMTGSTVFLCPPGTVAGADVRGPAPGSREIALLGVDKPIPYVNAVLLSGGSAFGLAAADGVMRFLEEKNVGHPTPLKPIPIVPSAIVYDLILTQGRAFPSAGTGYAACLDARDDNFTQGNVGAGLGVTVGKWSGWERTMKSGFGLASYRIDGLVVGAAAVVNAVGDVVEADGRVLAGARKAGGGWMVELDRWRNFPDAAPAQLGANTTLIVAYTNARLDKVQANRLAQRVHDGMAIAIRPVHTTHDGDTAFALATGEVDAGFDLVANITVEMVSEAIRNSVRFARTVGSFPGLAGDAERSEPDG